MTAGVQTQVVRPPSITMLAPVMKDDSSEARNSARSAQYSNVYTAYGIMSSHNPPT